MSKRTFIVFGLLVVWYTLNVESVAKRAAFVAAPLGGLTLAQLGADVIRFDTIDGGLDYKRWPVTDDGVSLYWAGLNKGKRSIAIDLMGTLQAALGDLERVRRIVKLMVLVNSTPAFTEQHLVANGASELLVSIFGERGPHARSAFGVAQIPTGSCVEIEMIVEVEGA